MITLPGGSAGPDGDADRAGPTFDSTGEGLTPDIDLAFDSGTLHVLRAEVQAHAYRAGMPEGRAGDMVLAIHELAANAIRHGAGVGRLRMWSLPGALHCRVDDGDPPAPGDTGDAAASGQAMMSSLPDTPGHGLWVVRQMADQMQILTGPRGTRATVSFKLP